MNAFRTLLTVALVATVPGCTDRTVATRDPDTGKPLPRPGGDPPGSTQPQGADQVDPAIVAMFVDYAQAMTEHNLVRATAFYAPSFIVGDPRGSAVVTNDANRRNSVIEEDAYYHETLGMTSARILNISQISMEGHHIFVRTTWGCTFQKLGETVVPFPLSFIVDKSDGAPKIIVHIVEKDEPKIFKDLGLIP